MRRLTKYPTNNLFVLEDSINLFKLTENAIYLALRDAFAVDDAEGKINNYDLLLREKRDTEVVVPDFYEVLFFNSISVGEDAERMVLEFLKNKKYGFLIKENVKEHPLFYRLDIEDSTINPFEYYTTDLGKLEREITEFEFARIRENLKLLN